jgi:hypothetical protein
MLSKTDMPIANALPIFVDRSIDVAFIVPTPTGLEKAYFDATRSVRSFFVRQQYHDYSDQRQGARENGRHLRGYLVCPDRLIETDVSLYRPKTKSGDPRIWLGAKVKSYCCAYNLLAITVYGGALYVFNMSNPQLVCAMGRVGTVAGDLLATMSVGESEIAKELLLKLRGIYALGFIPTRTQGDPGVGDTLEFKLGIHKNPSRAPDYKGIELKAKRESSRSSKFTLLNRVPDWKRSHFHSEQEVVESLGYVRNGIKRLYCDVSATSVNTQGLYLELTDDATDLWQKAQRVDYTGEVVVWAMKTLREAILEKHHETFWISAKSCFIDGVEHFQYNSVRHTMNPRVELLDTLIEEGKLIYGWTAKIKPNGKVKDHGSEFRMKKGDLKLLFPREYNHDLSVSA